MSVPVSRPAPTQDASFSSRGGRDKVTVSPGETTRGARGGLRSAPLVDSWVKTAGAAITAAGAIGIAIFVLTGMKDKAIYSKSVDDLVSQRARFIDRPVRAEGNLVHGSLMKRDRPCEYRFALQRNGVALPVLYSGCVVPDTFRDVADIDLAVTVEGELRTDGLFEASNVLAKCPSKYEMQQRRDRGEALPHGPLATSNAASGVVDDVR